MSTNCCSLKGNKNPKPEHSLDLGIAALVVLNTREVAMLDHDFMPMNPRPEFHVIEDARRRMQMLDTTVIDAR